jgi:RNA ligase
MNDPILLNKIWKEVEAGRVMPSSEGDLTLFKYHPTMMAENKTEWNDVNIECRGIIFDKNANIMARPFSKFFNLYETSKTQPENLPWSSSFHIYEKVDGSCGIGYHYNGRWRLATPGSLASEQAQYGSEMLYRLYGSALAALPTDVTPIFEIVYPENRVVVDYEGEEFLSLLAIRELGGKEWHANRVTKIAEAAGFKRPKRYSFSFEELCSGEPPFESDLLEGFVVHFDEDNQRVKIKDPRYLRIHKLLGHLSPKGVIDLIRGKEYRGLLAELPKDLQANFDDVRAQVQKIYYEIKYDAEDLSKKIPRGPNVTRKDQALWIQANSDPEQTGLLYSLLDNKDIEDNVWKLVARKLK